MSKFKKFVKWIHDTLFDEISLVDYIAIVVKRYDSEEYKDLSGKEKFEAVLKSIQNDGIGKVKDKFTKLTTHEQRLLVQKAVVQVKSIA